MNVGRYVGKRLTDMVDLLSREEFKKIYPDLPKKRLMSPEKLFIRDLINLCEQYGMTYYAGNIYSVKGNQDEIDRYYLCMDELRDLE